MTLEFSQQIFQKSSNIKFNETRPVGFDLFHADGWMDGETDRHDEANSRFSQFCERT
jgi:hypothetical protein